MAEVAPPFRHRLGPLTVYAYHDYPTNPWRSPLYAGIRLGEHGVELSVFPDSPLRPFYGEKGDGDDLISALTVAGAVAVAALLYDTIRKLNR